MVTVTWTEQGSGCLVTDGTHRLTADTTPAKGGTGAGFRPHDLLAAALGSCLTIQLRLAAARERIPLAGVTVKVEMDRGVPGKTVFRKEVCFMGGDLTADQRQRLLSLCRTCPVQKTLSGDLEFVGGCE